MSSERDQLLSSSTVREGYFKLLDHSVYIPKYHKRLQLSANSPTLSFHRKSPSIGRNPLLREGSKTTIMSHGTTTKASNLNNSVDLVELQQISEAEGRELDKRALMEILQRNQKKYKPKGAAKSKSPFLMSNSISREIYSTYRKAMQEKLREHDNLSPELLTEALLTGVINPNSTEHSKDNATKKYTLPEFEKLMKNLRAASHAKSSSLKSPRRGIFKFPNFTTPRHSSMVAPSLQLISPATIAENKRHSILIETPSSRVLHYDNKAPEIVENFVKTPEPERAYILEPTIEGESECVSDSEASANFKPGSSHKQAGNKELVVDTLNLTSLRVPETDDQNTPRSKSSIKILGTRQIKEVPGHNSPGFSQERLNFFNLTGLNFTAEKSQIGPSQQKLLDQMKNKSLSMSQQQQLSKDYLEAVKRDNLQELQKFQKRYRELVSQLMTSQNMGSPLNKPRGYLNQSLASTRECPQNKSIFEDLVRDSFHFKLKKKRLAQLEKLKERDQSPVITRVDSSLELPKLSAKSAHFHFSTLLHQHLSALKIEQDYQLRRLKEEGDSSKLSAQIFGYPVTLLKLRKLSSAQVLRQLIFHPVFIKFLRTYQIFLQHKENPRMVVVEAQRIVKSHIERLESQLEELRTFREDASYDSCNESAIPRSSHYNKPSVFGGNTHYGKGSGDSAFEYSMTKEEQRRQAQFMKLSDIIAKCSIGDSKSKQEEVSLREDLKGGKIEEKVSSSMLADIVIPRLGQKDKELLFMAALSFLYERNMPEGGWRAMNRVPLKQEELVKVRLDQIPIIPIPKRYKTKAARQEGDQKPFREKHKQGGLGAKTYKSQLPSLAKILYPHIHRESPRSKRKQ